jgi:hypothetical protein
MFEDIASKRDGTIAARDINGAWVRTDSSQSRAYPLAQGLIIDLFVREPSSAFVIEPPRSIASVSCSGRE